MTTSYRLLCGLAKQRGSRKSTADQSQIPNQSQACSPAFPNGDSTLAIFWLFLCKFPGFWWREGGSTN